MTTAHRHFSPAVTTYTSYPSSAIGTIEDVVGRGIIGLWIKIAGRVVEIRWARECFVDHAHRPDRRTA